MKSKNSVFLAITIALLSLTIESSQAAVYVAEPYLVQQPPYAGMSFYVYKPHGMPDGWFLTFDGYAVTRGKGKIWVYGTIQSGVPIKTNYAVGSANPALVGIIPFAGANGAYAAGQAEGIIVSQPFGAAPNQAAKQLYIPDWSVNPAFLVISNWRSTVDRIGILSKHGIPVAWKGDHPTVIYAWMGKKWKQIRTEKGRVSDTVNLNLYGLIKEREKGWRYRWYAEDVPILTDKTIGWGYIWMGEISVKDQ